jgi:hypothetical protein
MPLVLPGTKAKFEEYGCGHYGCTLPTNAENIVLKITSDVSEANLARLILAGELDADLLDGLVHYHGVVPLEATYRRRPVYALWREEVELCEIAVFGLLLPWQLRVNEYVEHAKKVWKHVAPPRKGWQDRAENIMLAYEGRRASRAGYNQLEHFKSALYVAQNMANTPDIYRVGELLWYLIDNGIMICDPHLNNLGFAPRDGEDKALVLFDPGQVIFFNPDQQPEY